MYQEILKAKKSYIFKMTTTPEDSNNDLKTYGAISNCLLWNEKVSAIPPLHADSSFISNYRKYKHIKNNSVLSPLLYKTNTKIRSFRVSVENYI